MFIFFLQLRETLHGGRLYVFTVLIAITWALWCLKAWLSRRYTPWTEDYETTTSVVIPVVDEPCGLFHEVLDLITEQTPDQVIVVINGPRNEKLEKVCDTYPGVDWMWTAVPGKRNAINEGLQRATCDIVVLSGSSWPDSELTAFRPFIEVARRSFGLTAGDTQAEAAQKLDAGLACLALAGNENLALLMNLLGLRPPTGTVRVWSVTERSE